MPLIKTTKRKFKILFITLGSFLVSCMIILLFTPALILFFIISELIYIVLKFRFGSKVSRPRGMDILQGMENKESRAYINTIGRFNGVADISKIRQRLKERGIDPVYENGQKPFRRLTQVFEKYYGYYIFRDVEDFDLNKHAYQIKLEDVLKDNTDASTVNMENIEDSKTADYYQHVVHQLLKKFGSKPLLDGLPKWEVVVVQDSADKYTVMYRIHHSITDGVYFTRWMLEFIADDKIFIAPLYNYHEPNFIKRMLVNIWAMCLLPYGLFRLSFNFEENPLHGPKLSGVKNYFLSKRVPLSILKEIKLKTKTSMNTILFSCLSYAFMSNFKRRNKEVSQVAVLVNVGLQNMSKPVVFKNSFALKGILVPVSIKTELPIQNNTSLSPSSLARLQQVDRNMEQMKQDISFLAIHWMLMTLATLLPVSLVQVLLTTKGLTASLSNVAGPQEKDLSIFGDKQDDIAFWIPDRGPLGMGVSVIGWKGNILIGLTADTALIPTKEEGYRFINDFIEEIYNLRRDLDLEAKEKNEFFLKNIP